MAHILNENLEIPPPSIRMTGREKSKPVVRVPSLPELDGTYGPTTIYDMVPPGSTITLSISYLNIHDADELCNVQDERGAQLTITEDCGKEWSGSLISYADRRAPGTEIAEDIQIRLIINA